MLRHWALRVSQLLLVTVGLTAFCAPAATATTASFFDRQPVYTWDVDATSAAGNLGLLSITGKQLDLGIGLATSFQADIDQATAVNSTQRVEAEASSATGLYEAWDVAPCAAYGHENQAASIDVLNTETNQITRLSMPAGFAHAGADAISVNDDDTVTALVSSVDGTCENTTASSPGPQKGTAAILTASAGSAHMTVVASAPNDTGAGDHSVVNVSPNNSTFVICDERPPNYTITAVSLGSQLVVDTAQRTFPDGVRDLEICAASDTGLGAMVVQRTAGRPTAVLSTGPSLDRYLQLNRTIGVASDSFRAQLPDAGNVYSAFSPSEPLLLLAGSGAPVIVNVRTGQLLKTTIGPKTRGFSFVSGESASSQHDSYTGWIAPDEAVMRLSNYGTSGGTVVLNTATKRWSGGLTWKAPAGQHGNTLTYCPLPQGRVLAINWAGLKFWGDDTLTLISDYGKELTRINAAALGTTFNVSCPSTESGYIYVSAGPKPASGHDEQPVGGWQTALFAVPVAAIDGSPWIRDISPNAPSTGPG
jgi:hypothetical protein